MFDFAWSEIGLIAVVALIFIGPKDLPVAIKAVSGMIKKARKMAGEFQTHVDEMVKDADLGEVRDQIRQIRNFDLRGEVERTVDADGSLRRTLNENPAADWHGTSTAAASETATLERPEEPARPEVPWVLPPNTREPYSLEPSPTNLAPAFIPPRRGR
jgi:sec-independent protein translocase protein TatB